MTNLYCLILIEQRLAREGPASVNDAVRAPIGKRVFPVGMQVPTDILMRYQMAVLFQAYNVEQTRGAGHHS